MEEMSECKIFILYDLNIEAIHGGILGFGFSSNGF